MKCYLLVCITRSEKKRQFIITQAAFYENYLINSAFSLIQFWICVFIFFPFSKVLVMSVYSLSFENAYIRFSYFYIFMQFLWYLLILFLLYFYAWRFSIGLSTWTYITFFFFVSLACCFYLFIRIIIFFISVW